MSKEETAAAGKQPDAGEQSTETAQKPLLAVEDVARIAHEINRAYLLALGDDSVLPWEDLDGKAKASLVKGVRYRLANPMASPKAQHEAWLEEKKSDNWCHGPVKDAKLKRHPCFLPYEQLPLERRVQDYLFCGAVTALTKHLD